MLHMNYKLWMKFVIPLALYQLLVPTPCEATCTPDLVSNSTIDPDATSFNSTDAVTYTCDVGFNFTSGDLNRTCQADGTWSGDPPVCTVSNIRVFGRIAVVALVGGKFSEKEEVVSVMSAETAVYNVEESTNSGSIRAHKKRKNDSTIEWEVGSNNEGSDVSLDEGDKDAIRRHLKFVNMDIKLREELIDEETVIQCVALPIPAHSSVNLLRTAFNYNTIITYSCDVGYDVTSDDDSRTCQEDGTWSEALLVCEIVQCTAPPAPDHATVDVTQSSYNYSTTLTYTCDTGFEFYSGNLSRTCSEYGNWSGDEPVCTIVQCTALPAPDHAKVDVIQSSYNYSTTITYTCDTGFDFSGGNLSRTCSEYGNWSGDEPVCSIVQCTAPPAPDHATVDVTLSSYNYSTTLTYTCDTGFEISTGNLMRTCLEYGNWSGNMPVCSIVQCTAPPAQDHTAIDVTQALYNYSTTVTYTCDTGFEISSGNLTRTCSEYGNWSGDEPVCTMITCSPPDDIDHSTYSPISSYYNWTTQIEYACDPLYHHVSGDNVTTCNETGTFPKLDLNCSVVHFLNISQSAPSVIWLNSSITSEVVYFDFDGVCDVQLSSNPTQLDLSRSITSKNLSITVAENVGTVDGSYVVTVKPYHDGDTWTSVSFDVYFGNYIDGFQAYLDNSISTIQVHENYSYHVNTTPPYSADVTLIATFEPTGNVSKSIPGVFSSDVITHAFQQTGHYNISFSATNPVTAITYSFVEVNVIAPINNVEFVTDNDIVNTDTLFDVHLQFSVSAILPIEDINATVDYGNGTQVYFEDSLYENATLPHDITSQLKYDIQGNYNMTATINNIVSSLVVYKVIGIWDDLANVTLTIVNTTNHFITGTTFYVEFQNVTRSGFKYFIDFTDGDTDTSSGSSLLYQLYSHSTFSNIYTDPGIYHITWNISNGGYNSSGTTQVTIENTIKSLTAGIVNPINLVAVDRAYSYQANGTEGSNTTISWDMGDSNMIQNTVTGEFTTNVVSHTYTSPGDYNISVNASNLVSTDMVFFSITAFYAPNNIEFEASRTLSNISLVVDFYFHVRSTALLPMKDLNYSIDFKDRTANLSESIHLNSSYTLPSTLTHSHTFTKQGDYYVSARFENIFGYLDYTQLIRVWDGLDHLDFDYVGDNGIYITNETARFQFINPPSGGYIYNIDFGDGTVVDYSDSEIYYRPFNLTVFEHAYGNPGVYTLTWSAANLAFNRTETKIILVQNPLPSHSYTLEPHNKKYPWINLQTMDISHNISLNNTVAWPTNATCIFYPGDGTSNVPFLSFAGDFFEYRHRYLTEGAFLSWFNCSNLISFQIYEYNVTVQKFIASFVTLDYAEVVPLNRSDTVEVFFHVMNQNFALIPYDVLLEFDYGDGTSRRRRRAVEVYNQPTYTHTYTERGNYTVTISVYANVTSSQNTQTYSIRIGTMYFEYSDLIAYINHTLVRYTMYGVLGSSTVYTLDFDDNSIDTCNSPNYNGCYIDHYCPFYGYKNVTATAANGTFVEIDWVNITCDNPITVGLDVPWTVSIPDGMVDLILFLNESALYLPVLNIMVHMGDPIKRDTYNFTEEVTYAAPFVFPFQYIALGRHTITVFCWNLINETSFETKITVTNENFLFTGSFDRKYSQSNTPMYISSMRDTEIFSRLFINANRTEKTHTNTWIVGVDINQTLHRHNLVFTIGLVSENIYLVMLKTSFVEEPDNVIQEPTYLQFVVPTPHVEIVGGTRRVYPLGNTFIDAATLSYDPANPDDGPLTFSMNCVGYNAVSFDAAESMYLSTTSGSPCPYDDYGNGTLLLKSYESPSIGYFVVTATATNSRSVQSSFTQIIQIVASSPLSIRCQINCLSKLAVTSYLQLVPDIPHNCPATFTWAIYSKAGSTVNMSRNLITDLIAANKLQTEGTSRTLTVKPNAFSYGASYLVTLRMVYNGVTYGPAYHEFKTNVVPIGGTCDIIPYDEQLRELPVLNTSVPYEAMATRDIFNLTCQDWQDEGFTDTTFTTTQPLFYYFFSRYPNDQHERQILYYDPGSTSNLVTLQIGDPANNFTLEVVLRICDIFGDYTEKVYTVLSKPDPSITSEALNSITDTEQVDVVKPYLESYTDELIKANRTWDYRTLSRKITGITSLYNNIELNGTSSVVISPEELTNLGGDGELGWSDYWKIIVEVQESLLANHLVKVSEEYVYYVYESISTWPPERRITLPAIQTVSRAVSATLQKKAYSNVTAAVMAAKIADVLAKNLANHVEDRTFPITWMVLSAVEGLKTLCRNILAELQTVLTPNLPQDPTSDTMRQFLEYIFVFKPEDENSQALSLQEQTFLAQKQLQRYYLDKYIKSKASKESLPYLTFALRNLTYALSKLTEVGQPAYTIDNDFFYLSAELVPANLLIDTTVLRPRVGVDVMSLISYDPGLCEAATIPVQTTVFKENPYFWGQFGDRITSYVPVFQFGDAKLGGDTVTFRLENKITPQCTDETPTYEEGDTNKMIYILFDRKFPEDDILIFIRPNTTELIYTVYLNAEVKPNLEENLYEYTTPMVRDESYNLEDGYKLLVKSSDYTSTGKIWIGLKPNLENSDDNSLLFRSFCANVTSVSCLSWVAGVNGEYYWDKDMCVVSTASTKIDTFCECQNTNKTLTVGTTFLVPPNKIDFDREVKVVEPLGQGPVIGLVVGLILSYIILLAWVWREDSKDQYKWSYSLMIDNDIADQYFYIVRVFTGMRSGSGTKSKIAFILAGERSDTGIRMLDDQSHIGFETGSVRTFVMSTRRKLGDLMSIRIWHDDSGGNESSWYLNKITVWDLQTYNRYSFVCEEWLDFDRGDNKVDRVLSAAKSTDIWSSKDMMSYTIAEHHVWISVFLRPFKNSFTRIQRLSCLYGQIFLAMMLTTIFMKSSTVEDEVQTTWSVVFLHFSVENLEASLAAVTIATILVAFISFFFRFARSKQTDVINSPINKLYRRITKKLNFDKSVLRSTYYPPTSKAIRYDLNFLPQGLCLLAWICLFCTTLFTITVLFLMSAGWKHVRSEEWMTTILCGCLNSILIIEPLKITLIVLLYCICCQRAYEPTEPSIDIESLKEVAKYNSASMTINKESTNELEPAVSPDEETLIANKSQRVQNHQLLKMFTQLTLYSGILYLVYTISYQSRDMRSYWLKANMEDTFQFQTEVTDLESYTTWLNGRFINSYFSSSFYGTELSRNETSLRPFAKDLLNYRVGPARLRQLRARPEICQGPLGEGRICYNGYKEIFSSKLDYCIGWTPTPCVVSEKSEYFTSPAWEYVSSSEVWGFVTVAEYTSYAGGGYFMKLDVNKDVCEKIFNELLQFNWFDRATRAVIMEFTMYNANTNLFVYTKFVAEFTEIGGVITWSDIQVFRLFTDTGSGGDFIKLLQFLFLVLVLAATIKIMYDISAEGIKYFKSVWNLLDVLALLMSIVTISIYIYKIKIIDKTTSLFLADKNAYVGFENLAFYDFVVNTTHGVLVFLLSVRVSRILGYSGKINEMAAVISNASSDLIAFLVIFGITYFAYVIMGTLLFGADNEKYKDLFNTYGTITEAIVGKNRLEKILVEKPGYAEFYYFTFVLFVLFTLTTMAAAILNFSISYVKEEQKKLAPTNIVEVIADRLSKAIAFLKGRSKSETEEESGSKTQKYKPKEERSMNEILIEFHVFIRSLEAKSRLQRQENRSKTPRSVQNIDLEMEETVRY